MYLHSIYFFVKSGEIVKMIRMPNCIENRMDKEI